jgi:hypothetical protein
MAAAMAATQGKRTIASTKAGWGFGTGILHPSNLVSRSFWRAERTRKSKNDL